MPGKVAKELENVPRSLSQEERLLKGSTYWSAKVQWEVTLKLIFCSRQVWEEASTRSTRTRAFERCPQRRNVDEKQLQMEDTHLEQLDKNREILRTKKGSNSETMYRQFI